MTLPARRRSLVALLALFAALSMLMATGACIASRRESAAVRAQRYRELHAIATLKVAQIVAWRKERLNDAQSGAAHLAYRAVFAQWRAHSQVLANRESILQDLSMLRDAYGYRTLALLDVDGHVILSLDPRLGDGDAEVHALAARALQAHEAIVGDISRGPADGDLHLDVIAPIQRPQQPPLALLLLRSDPEAQLFPLLQSWPLPSETAETDLVRREGDRVRYLNHLRHVQDAPLSFSLPMRQDLPAAQAAAGRTGEFLGRDYRGVEVLADLHPVPGSPWSMVAKIDTPEVMGEARYRTGVIRGFAALGILLCALLLGLLFYVGEAKLYHGLFQATRFAGQPDAGLDAFTVLQLQRWAMLLGLMGLAIGLMVMLGWSLDLSVLKGTLPGFGTTKANTALGMMLAGAALACLASPRSFPAAARTCAVLVLLVGGLTLVEHLSGADLHIDQLLFPAPEGMYGALAPGRMAPVTALNFLLAGSALLLACSRRTAAASQWIALPIGLIALSALLGHLLGPFGDYGLGRYFQMSFPAVVASVTAALGLLLLHPGEGLMRRVATQSMGGWMLRHLIPFLVGMPLLVSWLGAVIQRRGWLEIPMAEALTTTAFVAFLLGAAWWAARSLDRLDSVRDQAEVDLRESREMLGLVLDTIPQSVFWKDREGRFLGCNKAFAAQLGEDDPAWVVGKTDFDFSVPREEAEAYRADDQEVMASNHPKLHIIEPLQKADGTRLWIETSKAPLLDADGKPSGVLGIYADITERVRMEEALKSSEAWHRTILHTAMDGFMVVDGEGRILQANDAYARMSGYTLEELAGMRVADVDAQERPEETVAHLQQVLVIGQHRFETRHRRKDGRVIDLEVSVQVAPGEVDRLVAFLRDITERKRIEDGILASRTRLAEAQALAHLGSWEMDLRTKIGVWSEESWRLLGLDPALNVPSEAVFRSVLHPGDREAVVRAFDSAVEDRAPFQLVHRLLLVDGTVRFVETRGQMVLDADGVPVRATGTVLDITDLKKAEDLLRESEARLRVLSDNLPGGMVYQLDTGEDGSSRRFTYASAGVQALHGLTPDRLMADATAFYGQIHEEDRAFRAEQEAAAIAALAPFTAEYRVRHPSGELRWYLAASSARRTAGGHLVWDGIELDITDSKRSDERLRMAERMARGTLDGLSKHIAILDEHGTLLAVNLAWRRFAEENPPLRCNVCEGANYFEVCAAVTGPEAPEAAAFAEGIRSVMDGRASEYTQEYACHAPGVQRWFLGRVTRFAGEGPVRVVVAHDSITERKLAENRILAKTELLNLTGRMAQVGGMEFDPETYEGTWTEETARIHDLEYRVGLDAGIALGHYAEEARGRIQEAVKEASESGKPFDLELEMTSAKGIRKFVHIVGDRVQSEGRKVILAIIQDITEKKKADSELRRLLEVADRSRRSLLSLLEDQRAAELEIRRLNADLEQRVRARTLELAAANKDLEAFAYSVSHDLRAPLRHMDGFLGMLARHLGDRLDDKGSHYLKVAQGASVRMGQLVDGLLSFSRLGRTELRMVEVDAGQLVAAVIDELKAECGNREIRWEVGRLPVLDGDPTLLRLVFQNLIGNALKFTRDRPETVIEIQPIEGLDKERGILVRDNGVGFDPAYAHKLFGVFQRLHREDEFEGTGIGLANVHRIVTRHNGRVWAEGRPGEGAAFFLAFPLKGAPR